MSRSSDHDRGATAIGHCSYADPACSPARGAVTPVLSILRSLTGRRQVRYGSTISGPRMSRSASMRRSRLLRLHAVSWMS